MKKKRKLPDSSQFLKVLKRQGRPSHLPVYEHIASSGFIAAWLGQPFDHMKPGDPNYWELYVHFWMEMGFDCVPTSAVPLKYVLQTGAGFLEPAIHCRIICR